MIAPTLLFFASLLGIAFALQNPDWSDVLLLSIPCALASAVLLLREIVRRVVALRQRAKRWVIVDGSNVMYWRDNTPRLETVREVVSHLRDLRFDVSVVFDANAGYLISDRYLDDRAFARRLNLPARQVLVVHKGTPADPLILEAARKVGARIVTNDRYRDWVEDHPELRNPGQLIHGRYRGDVLSLDLQPH